MPHAAKAAYLLLVVLEEIHVLQVRVELDLINGWRHRRGFQNPVEVLGQVVRDADRLRQSLRLHLLHLLPLGLMVFLLVAEKRRMDEVPGWHRQDTPRDHCR